MAEQHRVDVFARVLWTAVFLVVVFVCIAVRIRLIDLPLERDEGEYAYAGQLMLHGVPPYQLAYNMKFPGTYAAYAVIIAAFGHTATSIHLGFLVVNVAAICLVALIGRELFDLPAGLVAGASYAVLSLNPSVLGFSAHATHFVLLPAVFGIWLLLWRDPNRVLVFCVGALFGLSTMMKQPGAFFALFGLIYLFYCQLRRGAAWRTWWVELLVYLTGVALPFLVTCAALYLAGTFNNFWFWTIHYAADYGSVVSPSLGIYVFGHNFLRALDHLWLLWIIAALGFSAILFTRALKGARLVILTLTLCSGLAVSAGLYFRPHYFVLILPALALSVGAVVQFVRMRWRDQKTPQLIVALAIFAACMLPFVVEKEFFFSLPSGAVSRRLYGANPFPEAVQVAEFIRSRSTAEEKIAVIGSEPEIYFYADRPSATGYIYMYPAMEPQPLALQMQRQIIDEIEQGCPRYVVVVGIDMSWKWPVQGTILQDWAQRYVTENYRPVGLVNIVSLDTTDYYLPLSGDSAPVGDNYLVIYERR